MSMFDLKFSKLFSRCMLIFSVFYLLSGCDSGSDNLTGVWEDVAGTDRSIGSYHTSVWAQTDSNVMVAGANGGVVQVSNGQFQQTMNVGTGSKLEAVWGTGNSNVYVGAELSRIFVYDGTNWSGIPKAQNASYGYVRGIWGNSESDIYLVGGNGFLAHSDGTLITSRNSNTFYDLYAIWGDSADDIYAVGGDAGRSIIQHYNGTDWSNIYTDSSGGPFFGVWGSSADNIYAVGYGRIVHFDGTSWTDIDTGTSFSGTYIYGVWGSSANNVYVVAANDVLHFDGTDWSIAYSDDSAYFTAVHGTSAGQVYVVGSKVIRYSLQ